MRPVDKAASNRRFLKLRVALVGLSALAFSFGCEADKAGAPAEVKPPSARAEMGAKRFARLNARARGLGAQAAKDVIFLAQELNMLDPRSERAQSAREARELLEKITADPAADSPQRPPVIPTQ